MRPIAKRGYKHLRESELDGLEIRIVSGYGIGDTWTAQGVAGDEWDYDFDQQWLKAQVFSSMDELVSKIHYASPFSDNLEDWQWSDYTDDDTYEIQTSIYAVDDTGDGDFSEASEKDWNAFKKGRKTIYLIDASFIVEFKKPYYPEMHELEAMLHA